MAKERGRWENIKELGSGGQGKVFLVRRPEAAAERAQAAKRIEGVLMSAGGGLDRERVLGLVADIFLYGKQDNPQAVAALKEFHVEGRDSGTGHKASGS